LHRSFLNPQKEKEAVGERVYARKSQKQDDEQASQC
jgi:hypothetical protein